MLRADLPAVLAIEAQANPVPWQAGDFEAFLRDPAHASGASAAGGAPAQGHVGWVWANPEVQGFACVAGAADEAELQTIAVARDQWGRGVGAALMEVLCGWAKDHAYSALHLEVREGNVRARDFYARWGFAAVGQRLKYYRDNGETAVLMVKRYR
jgi:ribosomal-protein-alanine N-acetyltransferase